MEGITFTTVGELKKLIKNLPNDRLIVPQVVSTDNTAWNCYAKFKDKIHNSNISCLTLYHPQLKTLPNINVLLNLKF